MTEPVDIPQFDLPLRLNDEGTDLAVVEQDSEADVRNKVEIVLRTILGEHPTIDDFGIPDPAFAQGGADLATLQAIVERWVPSAIAMFERDPSELSRLIDNIQVRVTAEGA